MKYIYNVFITYILTIIFIVPIDSHSQNLPTLLYNSIKGNKIQIRDFNDYYFDMSKKSIIDVGQGKEEFFNFDIKALTGSFLNADKREYLLIVKIVKDQFCSFFGHAVNGGNTTMIFTFDDKYEQIGEVGFQDSQTDLVQSGDIDKDGISEVIMESSYGQQGCNFKWWMIFRKDFNEPLLKLTKYQSCEDSGMQGEITRLMSKYKINEGKFIVESKLDYLYRRGDESKLDLLRTENRLDVFECKPEGIIHIPGDTNVNWDENNDPY